MNDMCHVFGKTQTEGELLFRVSKSLAWHGMAWHDIATGLADALYVVFRHMVSQHFTMSRHLYLSEVTHSVRSAACFCWVSVRLTSSVANAREIGAKSTTVVAVLNNPVYV
jgi:hypothetical protein